MFGRVEKAHRKREINYDHYGHPRIFSTQLHAEIAKGDAGTRAVCTRRIAAPEFGIPSSRDENAPWSVPRPRYRDLLVTAKIIAIFLASPAVVRNSVGNLRKLANERDHDDRH